MQFKDRVDAGKKLAHILKKYKGKNVVVYALPRGGVLTAYEVSKYLNAPLDLIIIQKIGHSYLPEYALGAVTENGHSIYNEKDIQTTDKQWLKNEVEDQRKEAERRRKIYCKGRKPISAKDKVAILVDDGIATGLTMKVGILELKHQQPKKIIVVVPICPKDFEQEVIKEGCELVALDIPTHYLGAVSLYYDYFPQITDDEIVNIMNMYWN